MESGRRHIQAKIIEMLLGDKKFSMEQFDDLCLEHDDIQHRAELCNLLTELRSDSVEITVSSDLEIEIQSGSITAKLICDFSKAGRLSKMRIVPDTPEVQSLTEFGAAMKPLGVNIEIIAFSDVLAERIMCSDVPIAIASLVKVVVAAAIVQQVSEKSLSLEQQYLLKSDDISVLSAGLSDRNVGSTIKISALLALLLTVSDNSAMDILLKVGGGAIKNYVQTLCLHLGLSPIQDFPEIQSTKDIYGKAWGIPQNDAEEEVVRSRSLSEVRWQEGFDYFIPLEVVAKASNDLVKSSVYEQIFGHNKVLFKGGSAPGVISALMAPVEGNDGQRTIAFALNRNRIFSIVEEIFVFDCARQLLISEGFSFG